MKKPGANNTKKRQSQNLSKYQPFTKSAKNSLKDGYSLLFDSVKEGILILDFETEKIIDANSSISDLTGFPPEFVIGKEIWDLNLFEDRKIYESTIKEIKKNGKTYIKEFPVFKQNGHPAKLEFISNVYSEGNLKLIQCNIRDTADKKKQISGNSETRFKQIAEGTRDLIWEVNLEGVYTYVNPTVSEILGYEPWELTGKKHFYDFYEPEKKEELKSQVFNRFSNRETIKNFITCNIHKKGHKIRLSTNGFPVFDDQNNLTGYRGVHTDITAKLESEEALRQSEAKTKTILEAISTGIMIVDPENHTIVDINAEGARLFGENKENIIGHKCHKFICPAEEGKCPVIDLKQLLDNSERNLINKKGEEIPVLKTATLIEIGGKKVLLENFTDITKRKRAEESIQLEKERYKAITNAIPDLVFRLDREGRYLDYKADENELAIQTENIIGRLNRDLMPPEFVSIVDEKIQTALKTNKTQQFEYQLNVPEKGIRSYDARMVVSGKNEVITFVRDITEQKLSAIEIQKSEHRYRELFENSGTPIWEADFSNIINYLAELKGKGILDFQKYFDENFDEVIRCISMVRLVDANKEILNFLKADSKKQAMTGLLDFFTEESFETAKIVILELAKGKLKIGGEIPIKILTNEVKHVIFRIAIASKGNHTWAKSLISFINITAKKEAEKALLESEAKLEEATKIAKLATWEYDIAAKQFTFNEQFYSLLNTNAEREGGYQMSEKDYIQKFIHPEDADILRREEQKALKTNDPNYSSRFDHRILYTGGEVGNIMVNLRIEKDNSGQTKRIYGVKQDITDRIQAEESLKLFRKLIDNSNDAIEVIDINTGQYLDVNKKACYDLGYTRDELLNMKVFDIDPNQNPENFKQVRDGFRQSDSNLLETIHVRKDGTTFPVEVNITLVELEKTYIIAIVRDIAERKHYEMELIKAKEKAEESDSLKSAFLANMSHEIRTPMNGILGFTELLKEPMLSGEEQRKYIDIIEKSGTRMLSIINDIISISKIEAGQVEVSVNDTNINDQLEYIYLFFKKEAKKKNIKLSVGDFLPKEEATIKTDREKIYAVLINLVKNAIKFTKEGSIIFGCGKKGEFLEFYVKDTGSGISEEKREIIFDRFRQGSENMNRDYEGAGLGLAICKGYLEMLGGKIWMYPNIYKDPKTGISYEKGSVFNFTIPLEINNNQKIKLDSMQDTEEMQNQNKKLKVLIVEDDEISLLYINKIAKDFAKDILNAPNGIEAVKICQNNPDLDLILLDLKMPKMGGLEAATKIRGFNKDVIIIAQTAYGMSGDKEEAIEAGCNDYISKPIKRKELLELVNKYFE